MWQEISSQTQTSNLGPKPVVNLHIPYKWYNLGNFISWPTLLPRFEGRWDPKQLCRRCRLWSDHILSVEVIHTESVCVWLSVSVLCRVWVWLPLMSVTVPYLVYTRSHLPVTNDNRKNCSCARWWPEMFIQVNNATVTEDPSGPSRNDQTSIVQECRWDEKTENWMATSMSNIGGNSS
jgi:hypothetical protein